METLKEVAKNVGSTGAAFGTGIGAVAVTGVQGLSAVGLSTGLATLGLGSMVMGVGVVAAIGAGTFLGAKKLLDHIFD